MEVEESKETSEDFKNQGNEFFKKKEYTKAVEAYTNAISKFSSHNSSNIQLILSRILAKRSKLLWQ